MDVVSNSIIDSVSDNDLNAGIVFDTNSGISETEQRDILAGIENAVRRDRRSLAEIPPARAKKKGILFPLLVNIAALVLLAAGLAAILVFRDAEETQIRGTTALYNSAERVLIREIRRDTALELEAKEREINTILAQLAGVDGELQDLYSSNQELTAEQKAIEANLQRLQEEYRSSLGSLQDDRSRILESSRAREASLRAQFDERAGELAAQAEQSREDLSRAREELERLSSDQEKGAAIEAQLSAMYTGAASAINGNRLKDAAATLNSMRNFINTPSFQGIRTVQPRRAFYLSSITTLEGLINLAESLNSAVEASGGSGQTTRIARLEEEKAALEEQVAGLNQAVNASDAEGSGLGRQVGELQNRIGGLQTQTAEQERTLNEQRRTLEERQRNITALTQQAAALNSQVTGLSQTAEERQRNITALTQQAAALNSRITALEQTAAEKDTEIETLRNTNSDQTARIESLTSQLATIRQALGD
ncbi:MAG: hypothetical protein LBI94_02390 [Treponema sp.]|nr:hypothetical protein [Treponema sp.]